MMLDDLMMWLEDQGFGISGRTIFAGTLPASAPASCISLTEYPGVGSMRTSSGVVAEQPRFQLMVRDVDYVTARKKAEEIYQALDGLANTTINETKYIWIEALGPPSLLGTLGNIDQSDRNRIVTSYAVQKERSCL